MFDELIKMRKIENKDYKWPSTFGQESENFYIKAMKKEHSRRPMYYDLRKDNEDIIYAIDDDDNVTNDFENTTNEQLYKKFLDSQRSYKKP